MFCCCVCNLGFGITGSFACCEPLGIHDASQSLCGAKPHIGLSMSLPKERVDVGSLSFLQRSTCLDTQEAQFMAVAKSYLE